MATDWTFEVDGSDRLAYAYLVDDSGNYSRSYLVLDWGTREARVEWRHSSQTGATAHEWHGHQMALRLPANVDACLLTAWLQDRVNTLAAIAEGYESAWDGHNHIAGFSERASQLLDELGEAANEWTEGETLALPDGQGVWAASQWLYDSRHELVTATSTDEEIASTAERLDREAKAEGVRVDGAEDYLRSVREELREDAE